MKILLLDIETAPNIAYVWGLRKQNINPDMLVDSGYTLCWAAKWLGGDKVMFDSVNSGMEPMLKGIYALLDEADVVVHYNGNKFDIPTLNKEFVQNGMLPPSPYQNIDLLHVTRKRFRFPSNKLDYVAQALELGGKHKHRGIALWIGCMAGDKECWNEMETYNVQDVWLLERVYYRLLPWITNHPNYAVFNHSDCCPNCGSTDGVKRGFSHTHNSKYQRFKCKSCGTWYRSRKPLLPSPTFVKDKNG